MGRFRRLEVLTLVAGVVAVGVRQPRRERGEARGRRIGVRLITGRCQRPRARSLDGRRDVGSIGLTGRPAGGWPGRSVCEDEFDLARHRDGGPLRDPDARLDTGDRDRGGGGRRGVESERWTALAPEVGRETGGPGEIGAVDLVDRNVDQHTLGHEDSAS